MEQALRLIVAGGRYITDYSLVEETILSSGFEIEEIVSGCCRGVDYFGEMFAKKNGIKIKRFPAEWDKYGKSAGPRRNKELAKYAAENGNGALILVWNGESSGSKNMLDCAMKQKLKIYQRIVKNENV